MSKQKKNDQDDDKPEDRQEEPRQPDQLGDKVRRTHDAMGWS